MAWFPVHVGGAAAKVSLPPAFTFKARVIEEKGRQVSEFVVSFQHVQNNSMLSIRNVAADPSYAHIYTFGEKVYEIQRKFSPCNDALSLHLSLYLNPKVRLQ